MKRLASDNPPCSVDYVFQRISGRYKSRILDLLQHGPIRTNELHRYLSPVTHTTMVRALRELESDQLIVKHVHTTINPHVEYALTPRGQELLPALLLLKEWGEKDMLRQDDTSSHTTSATDGSAM